MSEWRAVLGYEGFYEVSSEGEVRRVPGLVPSRNRQGPMVRKWPGKVLRPRVDPRSRYRTVQLSKAGKVRLRLVHQLVCEAFNGARPAGLVCAHLDGTRDNNVPSNLAWVTYAENSRHMIGHGTANRGDNAHQAVLRRADLPVIKARRANGDTLMAIAKDYGVHLSTIQYAMSGKNWR